MGFDLEAEERGNGHDKEPEINLGFPCLMTLCQDRPICWNLMPQALQRIKAFCSKYDTNSNPEKLAQSVQVNFASGNDGVLIMVAVTEWQVIGHLLVTMEEWLGRKFATIIQYECDRESGIDTDILKSALGIVEDWARKQGARELHIWARCPRLPEFTRDTLVKIFGSQAAAFQLFYDFKPSRLEMRKVL